VKREQIIEMAYQYKFDGSDGVFQWNNEEHFKAGFLSFERFVNDFEERIRLECANLADELGSYEVASAIRTLAYNDERSDRY
jgi:hypothetical protein